MPAQFETYNSNGTLQLSLGKRAARILTVSLIGSTTSGSISAPILASGTAIVGAIQTQLGKKLPTVTVSGTNVNWDYGSIPAADRDPSTSIHISVF